MLTVTKHRFATMGTSAEVQVVDGDPTIVDQAEHRLAALEARWSRFRPGSEISELNRRAGASVPVAWETILLLERAMAAASATEGRFDPTVGASLIAHGYDRTFAEVADHARDLVPRPVIDGSWPAIEVDRRTSTVCLPEGTIFDPGGIGKGLAADLVAEELMRAGAHGVLVNVGGDLRVEGRAPGADGWVIDLEHPITGESITHVRLAGGAIASTWRTKRTWGAPGDERHHLVDPATGAPAFAGLAGTAVLAARAWWAEVLAKAAFVDGPVEGRAVLERHHVTGYLVADDGAVQEVGAAAAFAA